MFWDHCILETLLVDLLYTTNEHLKLREQILPSSNDFVDNNLYSEFL